jgi:hypothetical protein
MSAAAGAFPQRPPDQAARRARRLHVGASAIQNAPPAFLHACGGRRSRSGRWLPNPSTSSANPAVTIARSFSDTFAGIAAAGVLAFVAAQWSACSWPWWSDEIDYAPRGVLAGLCVYLCRLRWRAAQWPAYPHEPFARRRGPRGGGVAGRIYRERIGGGAGHALESRRARWTPLPYQRPVKRQSAGRASRASLRTRLDAR